MISVSGKLFIKYVWYQVSSVSINSVSNKLVSSKFGIWMHLNGINDFGDACFTCICIVDNVDIMPQINQKQSPTYPMLSIPAMQASPVWTILVMHASPMWLKLVKPHGNFNSSPDPFKKQSVNSQSMKTKITIKLYPLNSGKRILTDKRLVTSPVSLTPEMHRKNRISPRIFGKNPSHSRYAYWEQEKLLVKKTGCKKSRGYFISRLYFTQVI